MGCRHEEAAAFAAVAQSQLTGSLGVRMGTVGPGAVHLLNGLYDAAKSGTPVLAVAVQVPLAEIGTEMRGARRLLGSYNLGSMANAMPQAIGAQLLDRDRQVVAFCGDGGLSMFLGDLMTIRAERLPVKLVVFDNQRLGMVKLEQEQAGLPEFGTVLDTPDFAAVAQALGITGIRVTGAEELADGVRRAFEEPGPVLLDVLTNPDEIAVPAKPTVQQGWGFAIAKVRENQRSAGD